MTQEDIYDGQTVEIMQRALGPRGTFVDVGCHEGKFMDEALRIAPAGRHFGFEPLPACAARLRQKYSGHPNVTILEAALSDETGSTPFVHNVDIPSHSGLRERAYPLPNTRRETIMVRTLRLDDVLPPGLVVRAVKIDVEGAELHVLRGAARIIDEHKPVIVFEFGLGASDRYGYGPPEMFAFISEHGMGVFTLDGLLSDAAALTLPQLEEQYFTPKNYYFAARPRAGKAAVPPASAASDSGSARIPMTREELEVRVGSVGPWFHSVELPHGVVTPGQGPRAYIDAAADIYFAMGVTGRTVLDVGAWDGAFSFEAERRGAVDVLAVDDLAWRPASWTSGRVGFELCHEALGSKVRTRTLDLARCDPGERRSVRYRPVQWHRLPCTRSNP